MKHGLLFKKNQPIIKFYAFLEEMELKFMGQCMLGRCCVMSYTCPKSVSAFFIPFLSHFMFYISILTYRPQNMHEKH